MRQKNKSKANRERGTKVKNKKQNEPGFTHARRDRMGGDDGGHAGWREQKMTWGGQSERGVRVRAV